MKSFTLKIITPEKVFFDGETDQIIVRTTEGDIGVPVSYTHLSCRAPISVARVG